VVENISCCDGQKTHTPGHIGQCAQAHLIPRATTKRQGEIPAIAEGISHDASLLFETFIGHVRDQAPDKTGRIGGDILPSEEAPTLSGASFAR
jgi:hypothetical protein